MDQPVGLSVNTNLNYTEPLGKYSLLQVNYNNNFNRNSTDKESYRIDDELEILGRMDSLSNVYDNDYITNRGGLSYLYKKEDLRLSAGIDYQRADLTGKQVFPQEMSMNKTFAQFFAQYDDHLQIFRQDEYALFISHVNQCTIS